MKVVEADVLVIGTGIAGVSAALRLARDKARRIVVITREADSLEGATRHAQGGIATVGPDDSPDLLVENILRAGAGLSLQRAAEILAEEGPRLVQEILIEEAQIPFDRSAEGNLHYTREGGHSVARILHVGDRTGEAIAKGLHALLKEFPNVELVTCATAVDLITFPHHALDPHTVYDPITCHGAYVLDQRSGEVHRYIAGATVLATGGLGRIYRYTTNPPGARGDGLAMAHRAGTRVINAEYVQFHPTTLAVPEGENFLISEAVRGEGGKLLTPDGRRFMGKYAPDWGDLAPRDGVARAIHQEMTLHGYPHVLLDVSEVKNFPERFPTIYAHCRKLGIDVPAQPIPVRRSGTCTPSGRWPAPGFMGRIAWRAPRCLRAWCSGTGPAAPSLGSPRNPSRSERSPPGSRRRTAPRPTPPSSTATGAPFNIRCGTTWAFSPGRSGTFGTCGRTLWTSTAGRGWTTRSLACGTAPKRR